MNSASQWPWRRRFGFVALAVASGAAGWALGHHGHDGAEHRAPAKTFGARVTAVSRSSKTPPAGAAIESFADTNDAPVAASEASCEPADQDAGAVDVEVL